MGADDEDAGGAGRVWVPAHYRSGSRVEGYWRAARSGTDTDPDAHAGAGARAQPGWVYPPVSGPTGQERPSSAWLERSATDDAALLAQLQVALVQQRDLTDLDELRLAYSPVRSVELMWSSSANSVSVVTLASGQRCYHKAVWGVDEELADDYDLDHSGEQALHEVAAWRVARTMGGPWRQMVAPTVLREVNGDLGSAALELPGEVGGGSLRADAVAAAGLFDAVIGNQDRHSGNYLARDDGGVSLIDHGLAFRRPGDYVNAVHLQRARIDRDQELSDHEREALGRLRADATLGGCAGFLRPERVEAVRERVDRMLSSGQVYDHRWDPAFRW